MDTVTQQLTILGKTVTFTQRIEACRVGPNAGKPGVCPGGGIGSKIGKIVKKATAAPKAQAPSYRGLSDADKSRQARHAVTEKILKKKTHAGMPTENIVPVMQSIGSQKGWRKPDLGLMEVKYNGDKGDGTLRLDPKGWRAMSPATPWRPGLDKVFGDINEARAAVVGHVGAPRAPAKKAVSYAASWVAHSVWATQEGPSPTGRIHII